MRVLLWPDDKFDEARVHFNRAQHARPTDIPVRDQVAMIALSRGKVDAACTELESTVRETPLLTETHASLATAWHCLKRPSDGNRERSIVEKPNPEAQGREPGVKAQ